MIDILSREEYAAHAGMTGLKRAVILSGNRLLLSDASELRIVDLATGELLNSVNFPGHSLIAYSERLNEAAVINGSKARIYDLDDLSVIKQFNLNYGGYSYVKYSADGNYLLLVSSYQGIRVYSAPGYSLDFSVGVNYLKSKTVGISRDGNAVAYAYEERYNAYFLMLNWGDGFRQASLNYIIDFIDFDPTNDYIYLISGFGKIVKFEYQNESRWMLKNNL